MSIWDTYKERIEVYGTTGRERALKRTQSYITRKGVDSLSYQTVFINGIEQSVTIHTEKEDMSMRRICSMPGETLTHGGIVDFADSKWLITELDAVTEVYATGVMLRCNYPLRWLDDTGKIIEKWCVVEDGTKYLIGEKTEQMMAIGDARVAVTIGKDADTIKLSRGRRFLIDDLDSSDIIAYQITKPNKLFNIYNGEGVFRFILNEVNTTDDDNFELRIADYYNWKPSGLSQKENIKNDISLEEVVELATSNNEENDGKAGWL